MARLRTVQSTAVRRIANLAHGYQKDGDPTETPSAACSPPDRMRDRRSVRAEARGNNRAVPNGPSGRKRGRIAARARNEHSLFRHTDLIHKTETTATRGRSLNVHSSAHRKDQTAAPREVRGDRIVVPGIVVPGIVVPGIVDRVVIEVPEIAGPITVVPRAVVLTTAIVALANKALATVDRVTVDR